MVENRAGRTPQTFLEALFNAADSLARKVVSFMPLGRGIRNVLSSEPDGLIGWDRVGEIAAATLELQSLRPEPISHHMIDQYQNMLTAAQGQVEAYTGLRATGLPEMVEVFDQAGWVNANIVSFRFLFDPISERYFSALEEMGPARNTSVSRVAHAVLTIQVGVIMGYLARNVLGQFDLSLPEPERGGRLYVVEPNIRRVELQMAFDPREFRQWITLHEVTHSYEFHCNSWLRDYLSGSMQEYLRTIEWRGLSRPDFFRGTGRGKVGTEDALNVGGLISIVSTPEQREILTRLQAVMCVLEGYSNHVMDRVGSELLSTYEVMKERFERRRETKSGAEKLFQKLIGLDLKLEQYKLGQQFVDAVVNEKGVEFLNRVWESAEAMPSMREVRNPGLWIERQAGRQT